jgi:hypothetical protein
VYTNKQNYLNKLPWKVTLGGLDKPAETDTSPFLPVGWAAPNSASCRTGGVFPTAVRQVTIPLSPPSLNLLSWKAGFPRLRLRTANI